MPRYTTKLTRLAVIGLSVGALLPATAAAMPINDGQAPAQPVVGPGHRRRRRLRRHPDA